MPTLPDLRPTPDRVRETLFNWLSGPVRGARCLDLFAGSGALGLEALSRQAAHVTFVERDRRAVGDLLARLTEWGASGARVEQADALSFLDGSATPCDIVFLDPPFASDLLAQAAGKLEQHGWLAPGALIYVEAPARTALPPLPQHWQLTKTGQAGAVGYHLFARAPKGRP